jgi:hypothetical protein
MVYPRSCPLCERSYALEGGPPAGSTTINAQPGGTPSPVRPNDPGRLLLLRCVLCGGSYWWDYFASAAIDDPRRPGDWGARAEAEAEAEG